ncbi:LacI family DNA-binding transcriptional regulator [Tessaracoccus sp. G1721]
MRSPETGKRVTISDIAAKAGVSIGAVSFALNGRKGVSEKTRARVLKVAEELGWAPTSAARTLAGGGTETVGLVLARDPRNLGVESFYMQFLAGLELELSQRSFSLMLQVVPDTAAEIETLSRWRSARRVDGVLLVDLAVDDPRVELCSRPGALPAVVVGDPSVAGGLTSVWTDDATSMASAVRHLYSLGNRRIGHVSGLAPLAHTHIRDEAFVREMDSLGAESVVLRTDYTMDSGAAATRAALLSAEPPSALIYDNDVMAVAGLSVAAELGRSVPEDLSIVAWDDSLLCRHTIPRLTALSHDVVSFGAHVARRLLDVLSGEPPAAFLDSTPQLVVRDSTRAVRPPAP